MRMRSRHGNAGVAVIAAVASLALILTVAEAQQPPSASAIVEKLLATSARAPKIVAADATLALRFRTPLSSPPSCVYAGTLQPRGAGYAIKIESEADSNPICALIRNEDVGKMVEASEPVESFVSRFNFIVQDQKEMAVDGRTDRFYLLDGTAKDPNNNPSAVRGWVDYDKGLWIESTITYSWGEVDTKQQYTSMKNTWMLTYQYLYSKQFDASLQIVYSNFRFPK
jgi:hypothetical protein